MNRSFCLQPVGLAHPNRTMTKSTPQARRFIPNISTCLQTQSRSRTVNQPAASKLSGLLRRRHVRVERIISIGKESNRLEQIEAGIIHSPESVYTEYPDPSRDEWQTRISPLLKNIPIAALMTVSGRSRSMLRRALAGRSRPRKRNQQLLINPSASWIGLARFRAGPRKHSDFPCHVNFACNF
jgi:hypothetical protein